MEQPPLPRPPGDEENLRRLREEAADRMRREPTTVYGGPPAPVYGGPPPTRRWTLSGILLMIASALAALAAAIFGYEKMTAPVYGGPPPPTPTPPAAVYGGPPPEVTPPPSKK